MNFLPNIFFLLSLLFSSFYCLTGATNITQDIKPYLTPHNQELYSIIHEEFEALRTTLDHQKIITLTQEKNRARDGHAQELTEQLTEQLDEQLRVFLTWHGQPTDATQRAPTVYKILRDMFEKTAAKSAITMPDIAVHLMPANNTLNSDALSANAISYSYHKFVDIGEEFFKLFFWHQQATELLEAILAHEFCHIKFSHNSSVQNEYDADAFAVTHLEQPKILLKTLDMILLANNLSHIMHYHTTYPITRVTEISRVLANYFAETMPTLGSLHKATTNAAVCSVLRTLVQQAHQNNTQDILFDLAHRITQACHNDYLIAQANQDSYNTHETYPGPVDRQCHIENCIFAKNNLQIS